MKIYVANGVTNRSDIISDYNNANTFDGSSGDTVDGTNWMQRIADSGREPSDKVAVGYLTQLWHHSTDGGNLFSGKDKNQPTQKLKRVDFDKWYRTEGNRNRPVNIPAMEQLQDSLVARGFGLPQRLAILATAAQEMDSKGAASKGVGGNGYLGLSEQRMPTSYLSDTPKGRGKQIHYLLEDMLTTHSDNWLDGGSGGPTIMNGQDGFNQFWESPNVYEATRILNKSYIRPAGRLDSWNNRAGVAKAMQKHLK